VAARPEWVDPQLFPFESRFVELGGARVHYVDEGSGPTLLMLHGNPTWSFLYRGMIAVLRERFRCVALDYPGFGLSDAPAGYGYTAAEHSEVVADFVSALDLREWTPVMQDWGGPIGFGAALREPERVAALAILNTWAWPLQGNWSPELFSRLLGGPIGDLAIRHLNAFVNLVMPVGVKRGRLRPVVMEHYRRPFPTAASREPTHVFPRELLAARPFLEEVERGLERLRELPALICFSDGDPVFGEAERERFAQAFPNHRSVTIADAGHYLQEDAPEEIADAIAAWHPGLTSAPSAAG
jgi:haloalkane dehalogenase